MTIKKYVCFATICVTIIVAAIYFYHFHNGFSQSPADWSSFSDYICGLLTPLLALLNIIVFIDLTKSIEQNRLSYEKSKDAEQEYRHKKEIEHQKQMQLFTLRTEEVRRFDSILEETLYSNPEEYHGNTPLSMIKTISYIESFIRNKIDLFSFSTTEERSDLIDLLQEGHHFLCELSENMKDTK